MNKYKMTAAITTVCIVLQALQILMPRMILYQYFSTDRSVLAMIVTLFLHMVSHAGVEHLLSNLYAGIPAMLYVEHSLGSRPLLKLYVTSGVMACLTQTLVVGEGNMIGASGAIFGVMGAAFTILSTRSRIERIAGHLCLWMSILPQLVYLADPLLAPGIAVAAHIGGCIAGVVLCSKLLLEKHAGSKPRR